MAITVFEFSQIFITDASPVILIFFVGGGLLENFFLHYKPCQLTSLSNRKSWEIYAFPIEKIDFFISDMHKLMVV